MKVMLDLTDLVARGELTPQQAQRLSQFAIRDSASLGSNILLSFGLVAVALGAGALMPTPQTAIVIGAMFFATGLSLIVGRVARWQLFSQMCVTLGTLAIVGGVMVLTGNSIEVNLLIALGLAVAAALARSGLLAALAILQLTAALGSGTAYWHATYAVWVERPALTIAVLSAVTLGLYLVSLRLPAGLERVALIGARTCILMVNLAFLVGSLFGDRLLGWPDTAFTLVWAIALLAIGIWGAWVNRRWVVNAAAVFGALHFYTQWFELLGASALSLLGGGVLLILFGLALRWLNERLRGDRIPAAAAAA